MQSNFQLISGATYQQLVRKRANERKLGEDAVWYDTSEDLSLQLQQSKALFVIVGIPEDVGVRANFGRGGAHTAFKPALESFLNQQSNAFLNGSHCLILGELEVSDLMQLPESATKEAQLQMLRHNVTEIDKRVTALIQICVQYQKIPIVIGGGHNNAYGNIKGSSLALNQKINAINCDPHADFRPLEGRHSGNGFSYAYNEQYLNRYAVFALHEQYNTSLALDTFHKDPNRLNYQTYESIFVRETQTFTRALHNCIHFVKQEPCGVELDMDAITNVPSSAKTSSGLSPIQARQYAYQCGAQLNAVYFHIAEAAPILSHIKADNKTGKLIAYLISDFIKGVLSRSSGE